MCEETYRCLGDPLVYIGWSRSKLYICVWVHEGMKMVSRRIHVYGFFFYWIKMERLTDIYMYRDGHIILNVHNHTSMYDQFVWKWKYMYYLKMD